MSASVKGQVVVMSMGAWCLTFLQFYFVMLALRHRIAMSVLFAVLPVVSLSKFTPFTLDGLGAQEALMSYLFAQFGVLPAAAFAGSLVSRAIAVSLPTFIGIMTILHMGVRPSVRKEDEPCGW